MNEVVLVAEAINAISLLVWALLFCSFFRAHSTAGKRVPEAKSTLGVLTVLGFSVFFYSLLNLVTLLTQWSMIDFYVYPAFMVPGVVFIVAGMMVMKETNFMKR